MKFNGIGDWIFKAGPDGRERIDYDALIAIIEQSTPVNRSSRNEKAIRDGICRMGAMTTAPKRRSDRDQDG